ncbi:GNAT family N-acetyltransferase [Streptomyces sp. NBC_00365]|uniref:GNAT family N-acetyltransferase n=1 Tax=Streptomyces sp. NBC_00365 TaxID=2975726 RepID=UPI0022546008|nr:GNAT family protein [Streptomyces sp. NBC_00365]MCX5088600.1 GNAT family N-acetyltransferase [Streptomyces sp. NBC_00365]
MSFEPDRISQVVLRPVAADDEEGFLELARVSVDLHHPWVRLPRTSSSFSSYLSRSDQVTAVCMVLCRKDQGDLVGMININDIVRGPYQKGVLGYAVFLPYAGQGYMAAGVALAVRHAFEHLDLNRVEADIQPGNEASLRLVRRLGFRKEGFSPGFIKIAGLWRDHERWAFTRDMELPAVRRE